MSYRARDLWADWQRTLAERGDISPLARAVAAKLAQDASVSGACGLTLAGLASLTDASAAEVNAALDELAAIRAITGRRPFRLRQMVGFVPVPQPRRPRGGRRHRKWRARERARRQKQQHRDRRQPAA